MSYDFHTCLSAATAGTIFPRPKSMAAFGTAHPAARASGGSGSGTAPKRSHSAPRRLEGSPAELTLQRTRDVVTLDRVQLFDACIDAIRFWPGEGGFGPGESQRELCTYLNSN